MEAPEGTRDLLFEGARRLRACEAAVARVFEDATFSEVIPPTIERAELFADLPAIRAADASGRALAVRADFTAQVARLAATRLREVSPLRLWYRGPVLRDAPGGRMAARERFQCGLELIGEPGYGPEAQVLALASASLDALGLGEQDVRISVGSTAHFSALLDAVLASPRLASQLRDAIDRKDRAGTAALVAGLGDATVRDALLHLSDPAPQATVLERADALAPNEEARKALKRLRKVVEAARERGLGERLEVDLGEVRGVGYYTGLVFNVYVAGAPGAVGGGGRYDTLLSRFGDPRPAVGFSLDLDALAPLARLPPEAE
jgi:ATP phosphoribosyltransferase regulatory subunit